MRILRFFILVFLLFSVMSCNSSSDDDATGRLSLSLSDAPAPDYRAVYVTIAEIQVHPSGSDEGGWMTVLRPNTTYDLLELVNGKTAELGVAGLPAGTYTQMRLILAGTPGPGTNVLDKPHPYANYLVTISGDEIELKIPSGIQSGIKLVHPFTVVEGRTTGLVLDFDASLSVVRAGASGKWLLKPTIRVIGTLDKSVLSGTVTDLTGNPLPHALVTAQVSDPSAASEPERVVVSASTLTDGNGAYRLCLEPGQYILVVTSDGFAATCHQVTAASGEELTQDFSLMQAETASVTIGLSLASGSPDEPARLEFRQTSPCGAQGQIIAKTVLYSESGTYTIDLPEGTYTAVAVCGDRTLVVGPVSTGGSTVLDFTAP